MLITVGEPVWGRSGTGRQKELRALRRDPGLCSGSDTGNCAFQGASVSSSVMSGLGYEVPDFTVINSLFPFLGSLLINSGQAEAPLGLDISTCLCQYYILNLERHSLLLPDERNLGLHD